jgi:DNA polymerase-3 subunit epsilon
VRPLAFIDVETTGLDPSRHEIIEIGVVVADPRTRETRGMFDVRVRPGRIEDADPVALGINGWSPEAWADAVPLDVALVRAKPLLEGALLAGHNVSFDRAFLDAAWRTTGVRPPDTDHHVLDTATLAWPLLAAGLVESLSLDAVCKALGVDVGQPHRALADAQRSLEVARRLLPDVGLMTRVRSLAADERPIVETILARIDAGRRQYGEWDSGDGRDYPGEALAEVIDALNYCAAELVRLRRAGRLGGLRTRRVYVCHAFADDPQANTERVRKLCRALAESGFLPVAPQVYLPQFLDEGTERERALSLCLELVGACDEVRVYGGHVTAGMRREIERAEALCIPVRFVEEVG